MENNLSVENVSEINSASSEAIMGGNNLMQVKSDYSAAIQIQKPRKLQNVILKCEEEAAIAGDEFYYSWRQGSEIVEGLTVGAAQAIARNWGNCAIDVRVQETPNAYVFNGAFIDLETGFNLVRPFRQNKQSPKKKNGSDIYTGERGKDIIFQIGASKATRNVVLNAVPKWLATKVMLKAKDNVKGKLEAMGIPKATEKIIKKAEALGIPEDRIESAFGKKHSWDIEKLVLLMGALRSIEDGFETLDSIFPIEKDDKHPEQPEDKKTSPPADQKKEPEQKTGTKPEVELVVTEEKKIPSEPVVINWEVPISVIAGIEAITSKEELAKFKKENKQRLQSFGGKDHDMIMDVLTDQEQKLK
jgi:hypothetical protein